MKKEEDHKYALVAKTVDIIATKEFTMPSATGKTMSSLTKIVMIWMTPKITGIDESTELSLY
jgi:hypothetical protein